jgi:hypothetical protein
MSNKVYSHACSSLNDVLQLVASYQRKPLFVECVTGGTSLKSRVSGPQTTCDGECQLDIVHALQLSDDNQLTVLFGDETR